MEQELSKALMAAVEKMPAFPKSVQRIISMTRDINADARELIDVIDKDPVVTVKILKVVNSSYFNLPRQITSTSNAVVFLGFNTLKNLSLSIAAVGMLPSQSDVGLDMQQYLLHSLSTAGIAKKLSSRVNADPMDCFIAGLLHDFGKIVLAQHFSAQFSKVLAHVNATGSSLHVAVAQMIGADHSEIGAMLAEKWRFPSELVHAIREQSPFQQLPTTPIGAVVFAANQISKKLAMGYGGNPEVLELPPDVEHFFGENLEALSQPAEEWQEVFKDAQVFANL